MSTSRASAPPAAPTLTARSWQTEAPLRMLMNNLDPEVAEHPDELVVYGGSGKAARDWPSYDAIVRSLTDARRRRDAARPVRPAGRHHADARVGAAGADRELEPGRRVGDLAGVPAAGGAGADDVRPDDGRVVDLHRHPGHPAGHVRDVRRGRREAVRRHARRHDHAHRRARRDGRRAAARRDDERRRLHLHRVRPDSRIERRIDHRYLDVRADSLDDALRAGRRGASAARRPLSIGVLGNAAEMVPGAAAPRARRSTSSPTRRPRTTR